MKFFFIVALTLGGLCNVRSQAGPPATSTTASASAPTFATAATPAPPPSAVTKKSAAELQKLVEPIALHPDPLIAMILPASAYPLEIVQAARFVRDTNNISKIDAQAWDENVKGVAKFPQLIAKMDADLAWTINLGQAFVDQPKEVMDTIQDLRAKAQKVGNLKTTDQQIVTVTNVVVLQTNVTEVVNVTKEVIEIAPANPTVIYVPSYPPAIYYPWYPYYPYAAPLVSFGVGMAWGMAWGAAWSHCNWGHGNVDIDIDSNRNVNRNSDRGRNTDRNTARAGDRMSGGRGDAGRQQWKPNQNRMRQSGARPTTREARGYGSGGARSSTGNVGSRPSTGNAGARPSTSQSSSRSSSVGGRSASGSSSAFNRSGGGSSARSSSNRGSSSRGGGGFSRGGGGGGRGGGGGGRR
jgi:hypothetical protein